MILLNRFVDGKDWQIDSYTWRLHEVRTDLRRPKAPQARACGLYGWWRANGRAFIMYVVMKCSFSKKSLLKISTVMKFFVSVHVKWNQKSGSRMLWYSLRSRRLQDMGAGKNGKGRVSPSKRQNIYSYWLFVTATKCMYKLAQTRRDLWGTPLHKRYLPPQRVWLRA